MVKKHPQFIGYPFTFYLEKKWQKETSDEEAENEKSVKEKEDKNDKEKPKIADVGSDEEVGSGKDRKKIKEKFTKKEELNKT